MRTKSAGQKLTKEQIKAMRAVIDGADVYSRRLADRLREVEGHHPELILITRAAHPPKDARATQPYFGAILTARGVVAVTPHKALRAHTARGATVSA